MEAEAVQPVMKAGFYNDNSQLQAAVMRATLPLLRAAAESLPDLGAKPLYILDCGCSQGANSVVAVKELLKELEYRAAQHARRLEVVVLHEDLPSNDFTSVMAAVSDPAKGYLTRYDPVQSGYGGFLSVYSSCVGRSFYSRLVPDCSLSVVFAFCCLHWLRRKPVLPRDGVISYLSGDAAVRDAFAEEFEDGFATFLQLRAEEALRGAALVINIPVLSSARPFATRTINDVARAMQSEGLLSADELGQMCICDYVPSADQVLRTVARVGLLRAWRVATQEVRCVPHPVWDAYRRGEADLTAAAAAYRTLWQAVFEPSFEGALRDTRGAAAAELVAELFSRVEAEYARRPVDVQIDYLLLRLVHE